MKLWYMWDCQYPAVDEISCLKGGTEFPSLICTGIFIKQNQTVVADKGIFRYKRKTFSINVAPERYQHITQPMADLKGVANAANDLAVHKQNGEEHVKNLIKALQRLEKKNLTLNAAKCTFPRTKIVLMGLYLTKHGKGVTEENVKVITEAT